MRKRRPHPRLERLPICRPAKQPPMQIPTWPAEGPCCITSCQHRSQVESSHVSQNDCCLLSAPKDPTPVALAESFLYTVHLCARRQHITGMLAMWSLLKAKVWPAAILRQLGCPSLCKGAVAHHVSCQSIGVINESCCLAAARACGAAENADVHHSLKLPPAREAQTPTWSDKRLIIIFAAGWTSSLQCSRAEVR